MQLKEVRNAKAVWAVNELDDLSLEHRGIVVITLQPGVGKDDVLDTHQLHPPWVGSQIKACGFETSS
jgi:hypothetical protein